MKRISLAALTLMAAVASTPWILGADAPTLPPPAAKEGVKFEADILPIFKDNCILCHGAKNPKAGIRLDTAEAALKGGFAGKVIIPGDSAKSSLVLAVARVNERSAMPPKPRGVPPASQEGQTNAVPKALTADQVGLIRAWIDQGAK